MNQGGTADKYLFVLGRLYISVKGVFFCTAHLTDMQSQVGFLFSEEVTDMLFVKRWWRRARRTQN